MRNFLRQLQRGVSNGGFLAAVALTLYSWWFVNSNASLSLSDPRAYFGSGDFSYHFRVSLELGFFHTAIPLAAMLPLGFWLCEEISTRYIDLALGRQNLRGYLSGRMAAAALSGALAVLAGSLIYILWLLLLSGPASTDEALTRMLAEHSVHGWRLLPGYFHVYVTESVARLLLSAMVWALVACGFSALWPNKAFVFVAVFAASVLLDALVGALFGQENRLSNLQVQSRGLEVPLNLAFLRQTLYLLGALLFSAFALFLRFGKGPKRAWQRARHWAAGRLAGGRARLGLMLPRAVCATGLGRLMVDLRAFLSVKTLLPAAIVPLILLFSGGAVPPRFSVGDLWLRVFSGLPWVEATWADVQGTALWAVLFSPVLLGNALNLSRELGGRCLSTLHRHPSVLAWWRGKCLATAAYSLAAVGVMFLSVLVAGLVMGARGVAVYRQGAEGFVSANTSVLWALFYVFLFQALVLSLMQTAVHLLTGSMQAGALAFLLPMMVCLLLYADFDRPRNGEVLFNWGMLARSELFSPALELTGEGEPLPLAAVPVQKALWGLFAWAAGLFLACTQLVRLVRVGERDLRA